MGSECTFLTNSSWCWCFLSRDLTLRTTDLHICWKKISSCLKWWLWCPPSYRDTRSGQILNYQRRRAECAGIYWTPSMCLVLVWILGILNLCTYFSLWLHVQRDVRLCQSRVEHDLLFLLSICGTWVLKSWRTFQRQASSKRLSGDVGAGVPGYKDCTPEEAFKTFPTVWLTEFSQISVHGNLTCLTTSKRLNFWTQVSLIRQVPVSQG